mmetsp:Transcript_17838/g.38381  ORF Transcript_17838/g.38381 Transcript_17838/m.38381 type:complete len:123 (-) Transcript_17838:504-872(-)|eukprot:CAMPEP_0202902738 /NCGR_PEP_ID=MMETSP1392-20130828/17025_1 /ASSEMBLY_ACC=CAM_ASM_000868 /TAXON_ID=225041 /ORGANISM="Chlamydomonas chlamydogama, Strain SAG 11-48b" /LENGTH=122 /DNA_ID=CAMNT_0049589545 /DNA_START=98 /DNA_END=466 /DNA_ORIENTATION=-
MGGGHHHHAPAVPEGPHAKLLANKSGLCPPDFHYTRETWYPHGGFYVDPKGWRKNLGLALAGAGLIYYGVWQYSIQQEVRLRAPKTWIPSLLWNPNVPDPVDFRGRTLDRVTGKPIEAEQEH